MASCRGLPTSEKLTSGEWKIAAAAGASKLDGVSSASSSGSALAAATWVRGILLGTQDGTSSDIWAFSLLSHCWGFTCRHCVITSTKGFQATEKFSNSAFCMLATRGV